MRGTEAGAFAGARIAATRGVRRKGPGSGDGATRRHGCGGTGGPGGGPGLSDARVAGAFLSGIGHAGVVGLAAIGPPFLWAPRDRPVPAVVVTLLSPAELAALDPAAAARRHLRGRRRPPPPSRPPSPMPPPLVPAPGGGAAPRGDDARPGFDAAAPLGVGEAPPAGAPDEGCGDRAEPAGGARRRAGPEVDRRRCAPDYAAQVQRAVTPRPGLSGGGPGARARGAGGVPARARRADGRLLASQLLQSSGAMTLDRAALDTVRRATYPPAPAAIEAERMPVAVEVVFAGSDR